MLTKYYIKKKTEKNSERYNAIVHKQNLDSR